MKKNPQAFYKLNDDNFNESVSDIVTKAFEKNKILKYRNRLIQNIDPIYLEPTPTNPFAIRAHFMAPVKKFAGITFDTYWFNMMVVWLYTCILYVTLYFESIKKLLSIKINLKMKSSKKK